jgi:hypothetical protein
LVKEHLQQALFSLMGNVSYQKIVIGKQLFNYIRGKKNIQKISV